MPAVIILGSPPRALFIFFHSPSAEKVRSRTNSSFNTSGELPAARAARCPRAGCALRAKRVRRRKMRRTEMPPSRRKTQMSAAQRQQTLQRLLALCGPRTLCGLRTLYRTQALCRLWARCCLRTYHIAADAKNRLRGSAYARAPPHQPLPQHSGEQRAAQGALRAHGLSAHRSPRRERPVRQASPPFFFFSFRHLLSAPRHMPAALLFPHAVDNSSVLFFNITRAAGSTQQHESPAQRHHTAAGITRTSV